MVRYYYIPGKSGIENKLSAVLRTIVRILNGARLPFGGIVRQNAVFGSAAEEHLGRIAVFPALAGVVKRKAQGYSVFGRQF